MFEFCFCRRKGAISGTGESIFQRIAKAVLRKIHEAQALEGPFEAQSGRRAR